MCDTYTQQSSNVPDMAGASTLQGVWGAITLPVHQYKLGKVGVWVCHSAVGVLDFPTVQIIHHLLKIAIYTINHIIIDVNAEYYAAESHSIQSALTFRTPTEIAQLR